jgi:hypothetical protein
MSSKQVHEQADGNGSSGGHQSDFALAIREVVWRAFEDLPPKGKPDPSKEYTVLAGLVAIPTTRSSATLGGSREMRLLSLATGNRSVGFKAGDSTQTALCAVDCHAEVLARKGFQSLLIDALTARLKVFSTGENAAQLHWLLRPCSRQGPDIEQGSDPTAPSVPQFELNPDWSLFLYVSQVPCGDCAVSIKTAAGKEEIRTSDERQTSHSRKRSRESKEDQAAGDTTQQRHPPPVDEAMGIGAHRILWDDERQRSIICEHHSALDMVSGVLRHKPGKGTASFSMSCSDKLLLWQSMGWQGALLSPFFAKPIVLSGLVVDQGAPVDYDSVARGLARRGSKLGQHPPITLHICPMKGNEENSTIWKQVSRQEELQGCGSALVAVGAASTSEKSATDGSRKVFAINTKDGAALGLTKKLYSSTSHALPFSRWSLATRTRQLITELGIAMARAPGCSQEVQAAEFLSTYKSLKAWCAEHSSMVFHEVGAVGVEQPEGIETNHPEVRRSYASQKARLRADPVLHDWVRKARADFPLSKGIV